MRQPRAWIQLSMLILLTGAISAQTTEQPVQFETRDYQLKWRDWRDIRDIVAGFVPSQSFVSGNSTFNVMTVKATPTTQAIVAELVKKYDTPPAELELQFYVILASKAGTGLKDGVPPAIRRVIDELGSLTQYSSFELVDSPLLRMSEGREGAISGQGTFPYELNLDRVSTSAGEGQINVDNFLIRFAFSAASGGVQEKDRVAEAQKSPSQPELHESVLRTSFRISDGETIVLGASRIGVDPRQNDIAIVTIVTANIVKP